MARLIIPKEHQLFLAQIADLSDSSFTEILAAFGDMPTSLSRENLATRLATKIPSLTEDKVRSILVVSTSLYRVQRASEISPKDLIEEVLQSLNESESADRLSDPEKREHLGERLFALLNQKSFRTWQKADELLGEQKHILHKIRVLTDIRPIFDDDTDIVSEGPEGAVIVHTLKITYMEDLTSGFGNLKEFFVALDTTDIQQMIDTLQRAKAKLTSLKDRYKVANIPYYDAESSRKEQ